MINHIKERYKNNYKRFLCLKVAGVILLLYEFLFSVILIKNAFEGLKIIQGLDIKVDPTIMTIIMVHISIIAYFIYHFLKIRVSFIEIFCIFFVITLSCLSRNELYMLFMMIGSMTFFVLKEYHRYKLSELEEWRIFNENISSIK